MCPGSAASVMWGAMKTVLHFNVYDRFTVAVSRDRGGWWVVEAIGNDGKRHVLPDVVIAPTAGPDEIADHLEVAFHEDGEPGKAVRPLD